MDNDFNNHIEDKPPFLGSWNKIYAVVLGELIILIVLFYLFTKAFS
jgi:hypothetical protein